jgi:diphthamide biosynthesis protein 4
MAGEAVDYYGLLAVSSTATTNEIKTAYRTLLLKHHPDRQSAVSELDFDLLKTAYAILTSPTQRAISNASLAQSVAKIPQSSRPAESISVEKFTSQDDSFVYPCRCGNNFLLEPADIEADTHLLTCSGCSETLWVDYEVVDDSN